jgi:AcrR family transcriptional regulator
MARDERQAQIVAAAATAFARGGFAATSMDDVAAEAGITRLIVYRHFESKEELYRAVLTRVTDRLAAEWAHEMSGTERRGSVFRALLHVARADPDGYRLLFDHASREPQFKGFADEVRGVQIELADHLLGERIPDAFRRWGTRTIVAYLNGAILAWLEVGDPARDAEFISQATDGMVAMYLTWAPDARLATPN